MLAHDQVARFLGNDAWYVLAPIGGAEYYEPWQIDRDIPAPRTPVWLIRNPSNQHNKNAIQLALDVRGRLVAAGHVRRDFARDLAPLADAGRLEACWLWMFERSSGGRPFPWILISGDIPIDLQKSSAEIFDQHLAWRAERALEQLQARTQTDSYSTDAEPALRRRARARDLAAAFGAFCVVEDRPDPRLADAKPADAWRAAGHTVLNHAGRKRWANAALPDGRVVPLWARSQTAPQPIPTGPRAKDPRLARSSRPARI
jgi:hypothetical protein